MRRIGTWTAAAMLGAGLLVGCGGDGDDGAEGGGGDLDSYCDSMKQAEEDFSGSMDPAKFGDMADRFGEMADQAPDEVADDWTKMEEALAGFLDAVDETGLSVEDLEDPAKAAEIDPEVQQQLQEAIEAMGSDEYTEASENIEKHAEDQCGIE